MRAAWWWIDRWRKSTAFTDMSLAEQGAYRNLLDELWLRGGAIPNDERILAKVCGDPFEWKKVRAKVLARFTLTPQGWRNETHDEVASGVGEMVERQRERGKKRARGAHRSPSGRFQPRQPEHQPDGQPRHQPVSQPPHQPDRQPADQPVSQPASQPVSQPDGQPDNQPATSQGASRTASRATSLPSPNPYKKDTPPLPPSGGECVCLASPEEGDDPYPPGFLRFWEAYPKQVGKGAAFRAWTQQSADRHLPAILAAIETRRQSRAWQTEGGRFVPNPAKWLDDRCWEDRDPAGAAAPPRRRFALVAAGHPCHGRAVPDAWTEEDGTGQQITAEGRWYSHRPGDKRARLEECVHVGEES